MITDYNGKVCYRNPIDRISGYAAAGREYVYCMLANKVDVGISLFASNEDSALLSLDEKDVPEKKRGIYKEISPFIESFIERIFISNKKR